jgi:hypothetical protein
MRILNAGYDSSSEIRISGNLISLTGMDQFGAALDFYDSNGTIESNVINPGAASIDTTEGIVIIDTTGLNDHAVWVLNNTVYSGTTEDVLDTCHALFVQNSDAYVDSNLFFTGRSGDEAIHVKGADGWVKSLRNNLFYLATAGMILYNDEEGASFDGLSGGQTISDLEATIDAEQGSDMASNNLFSNDDPNYEPTFDDFDGTDNDLGTMADNDWHLVSPTAVDIYGGARVPPDYDGYDRDGTLRTIPWCIGAYEFEGP